MKAICISTKTKVAPFGDPVAEVLVNGRTLLEEQTDALLAAGFDLVDQPPEQEAYLLFSDRTWFTAETLRRMKAAGEGRLQESDPRWSAWTGAQQSLEAPGLYELAIRTGTPTFDGLTPIQVDMDLHEMALEVRHSALSHAIENPVAVGPVMVHQIEHWSHIVRVNQLVLINRMEEARLDWEQAGWVGRFIRLLKLVWATRSLNGWKIANRLSEFGKETKIHPSAVVEFSVIGDGCDIGPNAVIRGSVLRDGVKVDSNAVVNCSVLGQGSQVGRFGHVNLCTLYPGAMVSAGDGFQVCVFGRDSFVAWGSCILDLSFGRPIRVEVDGPGTALESTGHHFLGAAIGHRARLGHGVKLGYGTSVPNDALVVSDGEMLRSWGDAPTDEPVVIRDGRPVPLKKPQD